MTWSARSDAVLIKPLVERLLPVEVRGREAHYL